METTLKQPFSNIQQELLKLFSSKNINDKDLSEIKQMLKNYFENKKKKLQNDDNRKN